MLSRRKKLKGTAISGGIVLGTARVIMPGDTEITEIVIPATRVRHEIDSLDHAIEQTIAELHQLKESAGKKMSGPVAKIFDAQLLIAGDYEFLNKVKEEISHRRRNAGFAYSSLVKNTLAPLRASSDYYMRQMAQDIEAVASRVLSFLGGESRQDMKFSPHTILVGKSFTPGDILTARQRKAIGLVTSEGGRNSHMALISRALLMPVVLVRNAFVDIADDSRLIIDGTKGEMIVNPTDEDWSQYQKLKKRQGPAVITRIKKLTEIPPKTSDGVEINVAANLALPGPADDILSEQHLSVGLYRTEFIYLANNRFPDEEAQYQYYKGIADKYTDSTVALRTFDLGYDKLATDNVWPDENNPALGWRGIRVMLDMAHVFKTQIRAILRASTRKNLRIMLPMVSDLSELEKAKRLISQVKFDLRKQGVPFDEDMQVGIMIEVPSAAMTADTLAQKADFMSIGTNDLTQYTLAADRMNDRVANLYSTFHPSVLKLIQMTVDACKKRNKQVSICGEAAGDLLALPLFIGMGVDMLSMHPARIFDICRLTKKIDSGMARHLLNSVMASSSQQQVLLKLQHYKTQLEKRRTISKRK